MTFSPTRIFRLSTRARGSRRAAAAICSRIGGRSIETDSQLRASCRAQIADVQRAREDGLEREAARQNIHRRELLQTRLITLTLVITARFPA